MKYLYFLLLIFFPLGELAAWHFPGTEITLHATDLVVAVIGTVYLFRRLKITPLFKAVLLFMIFCLVSLVINIPNFSWRQLLVAALYPLRFFAYSLLFFAFPKDSQKITQKILLLGVAVIAIAGILQYLFIPDTRFLYSQNWDDHYYRLISTFLDPGFTGTFLVLGLILIFNLKFKIKNLKFVFLTVVYSAMALTYSRATYLVYLAAFAAVSYYRRSFKIFLLSALVLAVTIPLLPRHFGEGNNLSRDYSVWGRINNWRMTIDMWRTAPVFGIGFNTYRYAQNAPPESHSGAGADSSLLLVLATTGIFGFASYLYLLKKIWDQSQKSLLFKTSFIAIFISSWFNNSLFYPFILAWLWLLLATENT